MTTAELAEMREIVGRALSVASGAVNDLRVKGRADAEDLAGLEAALRTAAFRLAHIEGDASPSSHG